MGHHTCLVPSEVLSAKTWDVKELAGLRATYDDVCGQHPAAAAISKYNPTPGTGRTGFLNVPPNNYPFYNDDEKYVPNMQADGGQQSEWQKLYDPTPEQAALDRQKAYESGVPHGYIPKGDKYKGMPAVRLLVVSDLHTAAEYGANVLSEGQHSGGPFYIEVPAKMRLQDVKNVIRDVGGILPGLQRLSYGGKNMEDSWRTLEHYGVAYWHKHFPHWPLKIRRF